MRFTRALLITALLSASAALRAADAPKPNIIVINIDDLGYADIAPFGSTINRTPNLDRLAEQGRRFTSYYAAPLCSPSRGELMTGCYPKRVLPINGVLFPGYATGLNPQETTLAELLKSAGYATAIVGKWHLGDQPEFLPQQQGFDLHFGLPYSNDMGPAEDGVKSDLGAPLPAPKANPQPPLPLLRNGTVVKRVLPDDQQSLVEIYTNEAVNFIAGHQGRPFFLYLAHNAVHFPIYPGKKWAGKSPHGIYSDWVEEVDWSVGRVLDALRTHDLAANTLVIFTSDNGGTHRASNRPLRGFKGSTWEGGIRVPMIACWPGRIPAGTSCDAICGMFDVLPTCAALAGVPLPADRKLDGANLWPQLTGQPDAPPAHEVFYYFRGLRLEAVRQGDWKLILPTPEAQADGDNAAAKTAAAPPAAATLAAAPPATQSANRRPLARRGPQPLLFNLKTDIGETTDTSAQHPEIVARLQKLVAAMNDDLGITGMGPGVRPLGRVENPQPLIGLDGKIRAGFEPK